MCGPVVQERKQGSVLSSREDLLKIDQRLGLSKTLLPVADELVTSCLS